MGAVLHARWHHHTILTETNQRHTLMGMIGVKLGGPASWSPVKTLGVKNITTVTHDLDAANHVLSPPG